MRVSRIILSLALGLLVIAFLVAIARFSAPQNVNAVATTADLHGWAWGGSRDTLAPPDEVGGIGWVSFNCDNVASCSVVPYKVTEDTSTGILGGHAWSSTYGWISFDRGEAGLPPGAAPACGSTPCLAKIDTTSGTVTGWARVMSCAQAERDANGVPLSNSTCDGWDGWIKMYDGAMAASVGDTDTTHIAKFNAGTGKISGFMWGGNWAPNATDPAKTMLGAGWLAFCGYGFDTYCVSTSVTPPTTRPFSFSINPIPDQTLTMGDPSTVVPIGIIGQNNDGTHSVTITANETVLSGDPNGLMVFGYPATCTPNPTCSKNLVLQPLAVGSYRIDITGTSGSLPAQTRSFTVYVVCPISICPRGGSGAQTFTFIHRPIANNEFCPDNGQCAQHPHFYRDLESPGGLSSDMDIIIMPQNGFNEPVTISVTGVETDKSPVSTGDTCIGAPSPCNGNGIGDYEDTGNPAAIVPMNEFTFLFRGVPQPGNHITITPHQDTNGAWVYPKVAFNVRSITSTLGRYVIYLKAVSVGSGIVSAFDSTPPNPGARVVLVQEADGPGSHE